MSKTAEAPVATMQACGGYRYAGLLRCVGEWVSVYAVPKMDCPSEERMIRLALNGVEGFGYCPSTCRTAG